MNNLNFLFTQRPEQTAKTIAVLDGRVQLFKRSSSDQWQCRFKLDGGSWHQASTGSDQLADATTRATSIFETVRAKIAEGFAVKNRIFKQLALDVLNTLSYQVQGRRGLHTYKDFKFVAEKYLIPFFGRYQVNELTQDLVNDFEAWRRSEMGAEPKASTKRHHTSAYNKIIQLAESQGLVDRGRRVPKLDATGERGESRPAFTRSEVDQMVKCLELWSQDMAVCGNPELRFLCWAYVEFLLYTGIRHSTESWPLRWRNIQWYWIDQQKYLRIWVSGKTGPRYLIAKNEVIETLDRLRIRHNLPYKSLDELLEAKLDQLVFTYPDRSRPIRIDHNFQAMLKKYGLQIDSSGKKRTLYSLRHTYATFALADGVDIHTVARQMGTSVLMLEKHYSKLTPMLSAEKLA